MIATRRIELLIGYVLMLVALAAATLLVVLPLAQWREARLRDAVALVEEHQDLTDRIARLEVEKRSFSADDLVGLTWEAGQAAEATARVQSFVNDTARTHGILFRSIAPTGLRETETGPVISFRIEFEVPLDRLVFFLKAIEFHSPSLVVTNLSLRRLSRPSPTGPQPELFVQADLSAPVKLQDQADE